MSSLIFFIYDLVYYADRKKQTEGYRAERSETNTGQQYTWLCCNTHGKHLFHSGRQSKKIRL